MEALSVCTFFIINLRFYLCSD